MNLQPISFQSSSAAGSVSNITVENNGLPVTIVGHHKRVVIRLLRAQHHQRGRPHPRTASRRPPGLGTWGLGELGIERADEAI